MAVNRNIINPDAVGAFVILDNPFPRITAHHAMYPGSHKIVDANGTRLIPADRKGTGIGELELLPPF
jgi:hypothetical protein